MGRFLAFLAAAGCSLPSAAQSWTSQLLPNISGKYTAQTVSFAGRSWNLDDFSYVGYDLGTKSLGSVPCNVVNVTATGDISQAVQAAVDSAGKAGGGSVPIPAGVQVNLLYQGAAPFEIAGLLQINAVVPSGLAPSDTAPLVLTIGNAASQTATIAIH